MANKFWLGGTGNWDGTTTSSAHWGTASGGGTTPTNGPGVNDTATFDGASGGGTVTVTGTITVQSITCGAFTGTLDFSANNNNVTLTSNTAFSGTGSATRTINLGNGTWTITPTANNITPWNIGTTTGLTFNANSSVIDFTGAVAAGIGQTFTSGGLTYSTLKVSGARFNGGLAISGGGTFAVLTNTAAAYISFTAATTITTLTQSAQLTLVPAGNATLTVTNAPTLTGTSSAPLAILSSTPTATANAAAISCASGTFSGTSCAIAGIAFAGGATFSFTDSFDNGKNTGATITAPSSGGGPVGQQCM